MRQFAVQTTNSPEYVRQLAAALKEAQETLSAGGSSGLVSGVTIKTINGQSVLGSGDLAVGGSLTVNEAVVDFGAFSYSAIASVVDGTVTGTTKVLATLHGGAGRDGDELEMAPITLGVQVKPGIGFDIYANALQGADGQFRVNYTKA
jgi:hypothetical protein